MRSTGLHLIAEAGTNHNRSVETGKRLIDAGRRSGANSVKFQMIWPEGLYLPAFYEDGAYRESEVFAQRASGALTPDEFRELASYCHETGVGFSSSVFDRKGIALLDELDVEYIKIASCDLNNSPLICAAAETGRRIVLSTGMSTLKEIESAVLDVQRTGNTNLVLMHCVSIYPAPVARMNLSFIDTLKTKFDLPVGLSDHTESSVAAAIAVAKGVMWIEKHITLDRSSQGFDHAYAMEPDGFAGFVQDVRASESACSVAFDKVAQEEASVRVRARRALYAARDIVAGASLCDDDVLIVRPEGPLRPNDLPQVLGCTAGRDIRRYEALTWDALQSRSAARVKAVTSGSIG